MHRLLYTVPSTKTAQTVKNVSRLTQGLDISYGIPGYVPRSDKEIVLDQKMEFGIASNLIQFESKSLLIVNIYISLQKEMKKI